MIQVKFKNLDKSEIIREAVTERVKPLIEKFESLSESKITITLEMENSPLKPGPDLFSVKLFISGGKFNKETIKKSDPNLYVALADVIDHMLEKLNRAGDRERVIKRNRARQLTKKTPEKEREQQIG